MLLVETTMQAHQDLKLSPGNVDKYALQTNFKQKAWKTKTKFTEQKGWKTKTNKICVKNTKLNINNMHMNTFIYFTLWHPGGFGKFRKKNQQFSVALPTP